MVRTRFTGWANVLLCMSYAGGCVCSLARSHVRTYARACYKTKPRKPRDTSKVSVRCVHCFLTMTSVDNQCCGLQVSPLKQKIASDIRDIFSNDVVGVVHFGDLNTQGWTNLRLKLAQIGVKTRVIPTKVATRALDESPVRNISSLFKGSTALVYGDFEQTDDLLSCIKSEPKLCLLGGKVMDRLMTPQGLGEVAKLPSLQSLHQELLALLCLPQRQTLMYLQSAPSSLANSLTLHVSSSSDTKQA